jgi:dihydropteroate synthase
MLAIIKSVAILSGMAERIDVDGVLNLTTDSFSDGGQFLDPKLAIPRAQEMFKQGAAYVDIGAEATNPWAEPVSTKEEWQRLQPIVSTLLPAYDGLRFSIDTRHPEIVEKAAKYGQFIVNDVTTFIDPGMIRVTAKHGFWAIASHLPLKAEGDIQFAHDSLRMDSAITVAEELVLQVQQMIKGGIARDRIIIDPGLGFGKSPVTNWEITDRFSVLASQDKVLAGLPIMYGPSKKRYIATDPQTGEEIKGVDRYHDPSVTTRVVKQIIERSQKGPERLLIRAHDVAEHKTLLDSLKRSAL